MKNIVRLLIATQLLAIVSPGVASAQGPIASGETGNGAISVAGELDSWTFTASTGDSIVLRMGATGFTPQIDLYGPDGALIRSAFTSSPGSGNHDAYLAVQAGSSGTFTVLASSYYSNGTGPYTLQLTISGITLSPTPTRTATPTPTPTDTPRHTQVAYSEPLEMMQLSGGNPYAKYQDGAEDVGKPRYLKYHTGMDVISGVFGPGNRNTPVYAAAGGTVEKVFRTSDTNTRCDGSDFAVSTTNRGLGNVVIVRHADGKFSLYGHLDCVNAGISPGATVTGGTAGTPLGKMGNSADDKRQNDVGPSAFGVHLHFEIKDNGVLGDTSDTPGDGFVGYTPDVPDGYGYHDPKVFLSPFSETGIAPTVFAAATNGLNIRSGPRTTYAELAHVDQGQHVVAYAQNGDWYKVHLPNANNAISGWMARTSGAEVLLNEVSTATQVRVVNTGSEGMRARTVAGGTDDSTRLQTVNGLTYVKVWDNQRFSVRDRTEVGGVAWYKIDVPASVGAQAFGWISGEFLEAAKRRLAYYALGDSIASGHGLPSGDGQTVESCQTSPDSYPGLVFRALQGLAQYNVVFRHLACTGAQTFLRPNSTPPLTDLPQQVTQLLASARSNPEQLTLASMTVGADDLDFTDEFLHGTHICLADEDFKRWLQNTAVIAQQRIERAIRTILAPNPHAYLVVTDYPNPLAASSGFFVFLNFAARVEYTPFGIIYLPFGYFVEPTCARRSEAELYNRTERAVRVINEAAANAVAAIKSTPAFAARVELVRIHDLFKGHEGPGGPCGPYLFPTLSDTYIQYPFDYSIGRLSIPSSFEGLIKRGNDCIHPGLVGASIYAGSNDGVSGVLASALQLLQTPLSLPARAQRLTSVTTAPPADRGSNPEGRSASGDCCAPRPKFPTVARRSGG